MEKTILISDIDGTMTGDNASLAELNNYLETNRDKFIIIYATGRVYESYVDAVESDKLTAPDAVILATGSEIYEFSGGKYVGNCEWTRFIAGNSGEWPGHAKIDEIMLSIPGLKLQEAQAEFRAGYYFEFDEEERIVKEAEKKVAENKLRVRLIPSHGKFLDVLPGKAGKGEAALFWLMTHNASPERVIVAGDSENDLDLFENFDRGIIVGNAYEGMKSALAGKDFYLAKQGNAGGVLEGLRHYLSV